MICETWKDAASLAAHEQAAHFTTLVPKIQELAAMNWKNLNSNKNSRTMIQKIPPDF